MSKEAKSPTSSKTMWVGILGILSGVLNEAMPVMQGYVDQEVTRTAMVGGIVMMVLRAVTRSPLVFKKK